MTNADTKPFRHRLDEARSLHRGGMLEQAQLAYDRLARECQDDADLVGLMGILALQQQRSETAAALLRQALELPADPRIHARNLNSALVLMKQQQRLDAARALIDETPPQWPQDAVPDDGERRTLLSLIEALAFFGRPDHARTLLETVLPLIGDDAEALCLGGRLALEVDDADRAVTLLERAAAAESPGWQALVPLSVAYMRLGREDAAHAAGIRAARTAPLYVGAASDTQIATILVLNRAPGRFETAVNTAFDLHFARNYISQRALRDPGKYRFASVFGDLDEPVPDLPPADLVFNNMASAESMNVPGRLDRARALVDHIGLPVINHPDVVARVTRQQNAERLRDVAGLRVPRIARYRRDASLLDAIVTDIESSFSYPLIVRHVAADQSSYSLLSERKTALRVHDRAELRDFIERRNWPEFYVIEYVDLRKPDGNYRKLRAALFPDEVFPNSGAYYREWMVGGWRVQRPAIEFYDAHPHLVTEVNRTLLEPEAMLGPQVLSVLAAVRDRMPLDVFGIDFDIDDAGRVVLFEVGANMNLLYQPGAPEHLRMPPEPEERVNAAFDRLVARRVGGTG